MITTLETAQAAYHSNGEIIVKMSSGAELRFFTADNPRLAGGLDRELNFIEISPFGLHWPLLDEDLSLRGLLAGDHGQTSR